MTDIMRYSDVSDTVGQLGHIIFCYIAMKTAVQLDWSSLNSDEWNKIVKTQVYKINDPIFSVDDAFALMGKQKDKCNRCSSDFSLQNRPIVTKEIKHRHFLGMGSSEVKFQWTCSFCLDANEKLEDKIAYMVREEEEEEEEGEEMKIF